MKRYVVIAMFMIGCANPADQFRSAAPSQQAVNINVPGAGGSSASSVSESEQALVGQRATFYEITRGVTTVVNGGVGLTLLVLEHITDTTPSSLTATHATWGPHTEALSPTTWKFDVEKTGAIEYTYVLSAKPRFAQDSAYQGIIVGKAHVVSHLVGAGEFLFDFTAMRAVDPGVRAQGGIAVKYDNTSSPRVVEVAFKNFDDGIGSYTPNDALYRYAENADTSGNFEFVTKADVDHDPLRATEVVGIKSQWLASGQGRSDVKATGGSLASDQTLTECWSNSFARTYFTDTWNPSDTEGDVASCKP
ncbi:MAG: hypothetical protein JWN44_3377 [Myxococcales bacterium]|nr:hypothetical protein [Myxococcales bacterium]